MPKLKNLNKLLRQNGKIIRGRWKLDSRHRLSYRFEEGEEAFEFQALLVAAEPDALVVSITEKQENGRRVTSLAKLTGAWRANEKNQIEFEVEKQSGENDVLTFRGAWKVGDANEIIYTYQRKHLKGKAKTLETLRFKGWWDISEKNRLTYTLEGSSDAAFRFRGAFQTPSILAEKGEIRYQLGLEAAGKKRLRAITLFGKWKLSDRLELEFEMEYSAGRKREIRFGAEFEPAKDFAVSAKLMNKENNPLGIEVVLTKEFLEGQTQAFFRLRKTLEESALEAGVTIPW